ncbi:LuxR family quorum sensing-dependent transcriptional regulator [Rhodopseudomonas rhenobacensis]|uniref:LuxR family quorum sensing-dependent transcriptional regulator n=1 Tax=Rhodopseudomonas rhenobacensis TaxID=87461 RepID=A0A7W7Z2X0_9BRAD|nr:LuxR family transcriptional regulator [Rhodopseudomonas rhenobacensis]MBB5046873.1 LuxR family quorum sensing-dependent transcriptional regulator [Rhodopseudomonas rhenobacensis]
MKLCDAISVIESADCMDDLRISLHQIIQDYGFASFAFLDAARPELDVPYYTGTHPIAWEHAYRQNDFIRVDPALARARRTNTPFAWHHLDLPRQIGRRRPPENRMMDAAKEFGFTDGYVVPFHYRNRLGAIHSSSTVFFWVDSASCFQKLFAEHRHELHLIMIYWIQRAIDVVGRDRRNACAIFRPPDVELPLHLTLREREVMSWAARGKTVADTAEILGLSAETVDGFIKQALRKLNASNKTHGVAKGIALGVVDF